MTIQTTPANMDQDGPSAPATTTAKGALEELFARLREIGSEINPATAELTWAACAQLHDGTGAPRTERDLPYGPHERHRLDLHLPAVKPAHLRPVLVFVHGGGFVSGEKSLPGLPFYDNVGGWAARHGLIGVTINYRLAPGAPWPAGIEDLGRAVEWVRDHIAPHGGDPDQIVLAGHSAGAAHVAGYLGTGATVAAAALISGPLDLADGGKNPFTAAYFGADPAHHAEREPIPALVSSRVPVLLSVAELDPPDFHRQALAALTALHTRDGVLPAFVSISGHNHLSEIASLGIDDSLAAPLLQFVQQCTPKGPR